jgi:hypothetical protein
LALLVETEGHIAVVEEHVVDEGASTMLLLTIVCKARLGRDISLMQRNRSRTARRLSDHWDMAKRTTVVLVRCRGVLLFADTPLLSKRASDWL